MNWKKYLSFIGVFILGTILAAACSTIAVTSTPSDADVLMTAQATHPLPTQISSENLAVVKTKACLVNTFTSVQLDDAQGDMMAWSPTGSELAYVSPTGGRWGWYVGDLVIYDMKQAKVIFTTQGKEINGDLTWSPDGKLLAFVELDPKAKTYTVDVLSLNDGSITDIFSSIGAKTDDWSSTKGVDHWSNANTLLVTSSCGADCMRSYSYDTLSGVITAGTEMRKSEDKSLTITNQTTSPDGKWQLNPDTDNNLWISSTSAGTASILLATTPVNEIKWSGDSSYVALRTAASIFVYQAVCSK